LGAGARIPGDRTDCEGDAQAAGLGEPRFAEAKDWNGLRRFRLRRMETVNGETLVIAADQNLKRWVSRCGWGRCPCPTGAPEASSRPVHHREPRGIGPRRGPLPSAAGRAARTLLAPFSTGWGVIGTGFKNPSCLSQLRRAASLPVATKETYLDARSQMTRVSTERRGRYDTVCKPSPRQQMRRRPPEFLPGGLPAAMPATASACPVRSRGGRPPAARPSAGRLAWDRTGW